MLRALAALPIKLRSATAATPFQPVAVEDIAATIGWLASRDISDKSVAAVVWDLMQPQPVTLGAVIEQFRRSFGTAKCQRIALPALLLDLGARLGDFASWLGWMPPMRTTAIVELRRGVTGDPAPWMAATGIVPKTLAQAVGQRSATIQDKWFARLFLIKALVIAIAGAVLDRVGLDRAGHLLQRRRRHPDRTPFPAGAGRADHRRHQPDGHGHRPADRLPTHLRRRIDRRHRRVIRLHGGQRPS